MPKWQKRTKIKKQQKNRNHLPFYHIPYLQPPEEVQTTNDSNENENEEKENAEEKTFTYENNSGNI